MANFAAIAATGQSLEARLGDWFADNPPLTSGNPSTAAVVRTEDFRDNQGRRPRRGLSIFFYRVDFNQATRAAWAAVGMHDGRGHLPLDLHFLITPWADNATDELRILGSAMECLETNPILGGALLSASGGWAPNEAIQIVLGEITTEEVMRTFDSLPTDYKLSVPYIARIVRVDSRQATVAPDVTTARTHSRPGTRPWVPEPA